MNRNLFSAPKLLFVCLGFVGVFAIGPSVEGLARASSTSPLTPSQEVTAREQLAQADLQRFLSVASFHVLQPLTLQTGFHYDRVVYGSSHDGVDFFISGPDTTMGTRAMHVHQGVVGGGQGKSDPIVDATPKTAVALGNVTWTVNQKADAPWKGSWIFTTVVNGVLIEVDGEVDRPTLESLILQLR